MNVRPADQSEPAEQPTDEEVGVSGEGSRTEGSGFWRRSQNGAGLLLILAGMALTVLWMSVFGAKVLHLVSVPLLVHPYLDWVVVLGMVLIAAGAALLFFKAHRGRKVAKRMRMDAHRRSRALFSEKSRLHREEQAKAG